jgi:hypothetical protein
MESAVLIDYFVVDEKLNKTYVSKTICNFFLMNKVQKLAVPMSMSSPHISSHDSKVNYDAV